MKNYAPFLENAFDLEFQEGSYRIGRIDGEVPDFIRGTYYLNGPAKFGHDNLRYRHWLDGDGMVCRLYFGEAGIQFTNRFVRSTKFVAEAEAGRAVFRTFGTRFEGDQLERGVALASPVNVSVFPFNGTLLAFGEQGLPWELDPVTLETRGVYTFSGRLNPISPFSAHPKFDPHGGFFNFGVSFSANQPTLNFYCFDAQGQMSYRKRYPLDLPRSMHDFGLSTDYAVFYLSPHVLDMAAMMRHGKTLMESLSWMPEKGALLLIVDRESGEQVTRVPLGQGYCLHLINVCANGQALEVDVVELEEPVYDQYEVLPEMFTQIRHAQAVRYSVDMATASVVERRTLSYHMMADFPAVDPRRAMGSCDDFWLLGISQTLQCGRKFFDQLVHLNWRGDAEDIFQAAPGHYLGGEPVFIPNASNASAGVILCQLFDAQNKESSFALFDAFNVAAGPLARLYLDYPVGLGFHAVFEAATG
jgi:carotenoid cleavage dioxygenase-like enzyme